MATRLRCATPWQARLRCGTPNGRTDRTDRTAARAASCPCHTQRSARTRRYPITPRSPFDFTHGPEPVEWRRSRLRCASPWQARRPLPAGRGCNRRLRRRLAGETPAVPGRAGRRRSRAGGTPAVPGRADARAPLRHVYPVTAGVLGGTQGNFRRSPGVARQSCGRRVRPGRMRR